MASGHSPIGGYDEREASLAKGWLFGVLREHTPYCRQTPVGSEYKYPEQDQNKSMGFRYN